MASGRGTGSEKSLFYLETMVANPFDDLLSRARSDPRHIVLAEGEDERIIEGAARIVSDGIATLTLLGNEAVIRQKAAACGVPELPVAIVDPVHSVHAEAYAEEIYALRKHKGTSREGARELLVSGAAISSSRKLP